jgi:hypothetical protein
MLGLAAKTEKAADVQSTLAVQYDILSQHLKRLDKMRRSMGRDLQAPDSLQYIQEFKKIRKAIYLSINPEVLPGMVFDAQDFDPPLQIPKEIAQQLTEFFPIRDPNGASLLAEITKKDELVLPYQVENLNKITNTFDDTNLSFIQKFTRINNTFEEILGNIKSAQSVPQEFIVETIERYRRYVLSRLIEKSFDVNNKITAADFKQILPVIIENKIPFYSPLREFLDSYTAESPENQKLSLEEVKSLLPLLTEEAIPLNLLALSESIDFDLDLVELILKNMNRSSPAVSQENNIPAALHAFAELRNVHVRKNSADPAKEFRSTFEAKYDALVNALKTIGQDGKLERIKKTIRGDFRFNPIFHRALFAAYLKNNIFTPDFNSDNGLIALQRAEHEKFNSENYINTLKQKLFDSESKEKGLLEFLSAAIGLVDIYPGSEYPAARSAFVDRLRSTRDRLEKLFNKDGNDAAELKEMEDLITHFDNFAEQNYPRVVAQEGRSGDTELGEKHRGFLKLLRDDVADRLRLVKNQREADYISLATEEKIKLDLKPGASSITRYLVSLFDDNGLIRKYLGNSRVLVNFYSQNLSKEALAKKGDEIAQVEAQLTPELTGPNPTFKLKSAQDMIELRERLSSLKQEKDKIIGYLSQPSVTQLSDFIDLDPAKQPSDFQILKELFVAFLQAKTNPERIEAYNKLITLVETDFSTENSVLKNDVSAQKLFKLRELLVPVKDWMDLNSQLEEKAKALKANNAQPTRAAFDQVITETKGKLKVFDTFDFATVPEESKDQFVSIANRCQQIAKTSSQALDEYSRRFAIQHPPRNYFSNKQLNHLIKFLNITQPVNDIDGLLNAINDNSADYQKELKQIIKRFLDGDYSESKFSAQLNAYMEKFAPAKSLWERIQVYMGSSAVEIDIYWNKDELQKFISQFKNEHARNAAEYYQQQQQSPGKAIQYIKTELVEINNALKMVENQIAAKIATAQNKQELKQINKSYHPVIAEVTKAQKKLETSVQENKALDKKDIYEAKKAMSKLKDLISDKNDGDHRPRRNR